MARTGERYELTCTVTNDGNIPMITWMDTDGLIAFNSSRVSLRPLTTIGTTSTSVLVFDPLSVRHGGDYTCQAIIGAMTFAYTYSVIVITSKCQIQLSVQLLFIIITDQLTVEIEVTPAGVTQQASSSINLTCVVQGISYPPYSYQWTSSCSGNCFTLLGSTPTLTELTLHSIDSGNHTCAVIDAVGNSGTATTEIVVAGMSPMID